MKIGLIGAPEAGKDDVVAHTLQFQYGFTRFAFADQIKKCYYSEIGITEEYFKSCRGTPEEEQIRKGLWEFSDKTRAELGPMCFIEQVMNEISRHSDVVVTDIRTEDELDKVSEVADAILIVSRGNTDYLFGPDSEMFPETRIPIYKILSCRVFLNVYGTLEEAREEFKKFYQTMGGK